MKHRFRLYLETSFWLRLGDPAYHARRKMTYRFFRAAARRHQLFLSKLVLREIEETPDWDERRHVLRRVWSARPRMVTTSRRAERIALDLVQEGGWSDDVFADMLHISYSMVSNQDALVSWDEGDLARDRTRQVVQAYGRREGVSVPLIGTPEEVAQWLGIGIR